MAHGPVDRRTAWGAVCRCVGSSCRLLWGRHLRQPRRNVGRVLHFADGTSARVYRETVASQVPVEPCLLAVRFRLRVVHGRGHALFRAESLLNTPLFVGFPGFGSKLWLAHDQHGLYRGLYEWDGVARAEFYARCLWRVLELVCVRGSIDYQIVPGLRRDQVLADPGVLDGFTSTESTSTWWRPTPSPSRRRPARRVQLPAPGGPRSLSRRRRLGQP